MISLSELNPKGVALTPEMQSNIQVLLERMNKVRSAYGKPMYVTSGVRSLDDHKRIYREKAAKAGIKIYRIPMGSKHLSAQAVDILDRDGSLMAWCKVNLTILEQVGLWVESDTQGWTHFQVVPPSSGNRFFKP